MARSAGAPPEPRRAHDAFPKKEAPVTNVATLSTGTLIAADKVEGTAVYTMLGVKLGNALRQDI